MEYQRKFRWANYQTPKCKEYLRNDFSHECAYCKLQESEIGLIDKDYFEIDHFRPQSNEDKEFDPHIYSNLYYSCLKCNGTKSNTWSENLLDPCKEDIFSGPYPLVKEGYNAATFYKYESDDDKGVYYIETFKLNSRYHTKIRKRRSQRQNNIHVIDNLIDEILHKFKSKKNLANLDELIKHLDQLRVEKTRELSTLSVDEKFESVENLLKECGIKNSIVFEEYNMDIKIKIDGVTYYCELMVDDSEKEVGEIPKFLDTEKLAIWFEKLNYNFGILYYYPKLDKLYFYPITKFIIKEDVGGYGSKKLIKLTDDNLIT